MEKLLDRARKLYALEDCVFTQIAGHEGGRNRIFTVSRGGVKKFVLRISALGGRTREELLAETEFVRFLARNGAPVADVIPSVSGRCVERIEAEGRAAYVSLFAWAKGMLLSDNGYRCREGAAPEEYFFRTGKALGAIHRLSKQFAPVHARPDYSDKYNMAYIGSLIPDEYAALKEAIAGRLDRLRALAKGKGDYGLVHFDFNDGNYHVDMTTGEITVFDFDSCMYCWYMFDLAGLWIHGEGWSRGEKDPKSRMAYMRRYFDTILRGYRTETDVSDEMLERLPLFIDMVLIENIVDGFEFCAREGRAPDHEDFKAAEDCLIHDIPYAGIGSET